MFYSVSTRHYIGDHETIVMHSPEGHEIPVLHLIPGKNDFPGDKHKLAANIASLLNGNNPLHPQETADEQLFWAQNENGFEIRTKAPHGLTKPNLIGAWDSRFDEKDIDLGELLPALCRTINHNNKTTKPAPHPQPSKS